MSNITGNRKRGLAFYSKCVAHLFLFSLFSGHLAKSARTSPKKENAPLALKEKKAPTIEKSEKNPKNEPAQAPFGLKMWTNAPQVLLVDLSSGQILLQKNAHALMTPSSMTKIMTIYLIFEDQKNKIIAWQEKAFISLEASKKEGTRMWLAQGRSVPFIDLVKGIIVLSGNDACSVAAEALSGTEDAFAQRMTEKARALGAVNTRFLNASGLPVEGHETTCWDLFLIAQATLRDFPEEYKTFYSIKKYGYQNTPQNTRNLLLLEGSADGFKTGFTKAGGYGMVASSERAGRRLILVINGLSSEPSRAQEARRLLNWGFHTFENFHLFDKGDWVRDIPLADGRSIKAVASKKLSLSIPKRLATNAKVIIRTLEPLHAPLHKGQKLGTILLKINDEEKIQEIDLVAGEDMAVRSLFQKIFGWFGSSPAQESRPSISP